MSKALRELLEEYKSFGPSSETEAFFVPSRLIVAVLREAGLLPAKKIKKIGYYMSAYPKPMGFYDTPEQALMARTNGTLVTCTWEEEA